MGSITMSGLQHTEYGDISFIGIDCCQPRWIGSYGSISNEQINELTPMLDRNVILVGHYPVLDRNGHLYHVNHPWHGIGHNADRFIEVMKQSPPLLYLHGHVHRGYTASWSQIRTCNPGAAGAAHNAALN
jgi:Icc-related predicted phosphoesterase